MAVVEHRVAAFVAAHWAGVEEHHAFCRNPLHPGPCAKLGRLRRKKTRTRNPEKLTGFHGRYMTTPQWWDKIPDDTGPEGIPVEDLTITVGADRYHIPHGTAWRADGVVYVAEHQRGKLSKRRAAEAMGRIYEVHQEKLAGDDQGGFQKAYLLAERESPKEARLNAQNPARAGRERVLANARNGSTVMWGFYRHGLPPSMEHTIVHEYGHNVGWGAGAIDESVRWREAAEADSAYDRGRAKLKAMKVTHPDFAGKVMPRRDPFKAFPDGVTAYGASDQVEDFAESLAMYRAGPIGTVILKDKPELGEVPLYFRDMFPERAALLDNLFPRVAAQQLRQVRAERESPQS